MNLENDFEKLAIRVTKFELAIRRQLKALVLYKKENPIQAKKELNNLWIKYIKNSNVVDMFYQCNMNREYMNLLKDFEKVLDS